MSQSQMSNGVRPAPRQHHSGHGCVVMMAVTVAMMMRIAGR